jgi:hypothetical protein
MAPLTCNKNKQSNYPSEVQTLLNKNRSQLRAPTLHATQQKKFLTG